MPDQRQEKATLHVHILEEKMSSQGAPHNEQIAIQEALVELKRRLPQW